MPNEPAAHWSSDDFSQPEVDYSGGSDVNRAGKRRSPRGRRSKEAQARQTRKWRARNRSKRRDYMRRYMAARRARPVTV